MVASPRPEDSEQAPTRPRLAWIDNLRVAVIAGVIAAHVGTAYVVDVD